MLKVENLTFNYGPHRAIDNLNFEIGRGKLVGFLGPNGAGKTTTLRLISGLMAPSYGSVSIDGLSLLRQPLLAKKKIGYLPEHPPLYEDMTVVDYLQFVAEIKGVESQNVKSFVQEALHLTRLEEVSERLIGRLSKGYRQRVGLAQALVAKPPLIILDEPTVGFDPQQVEEFKNLLLKIKSHHTVLWSTHILADVESTCDEIIVINLGQIVTYGTPQEIKKSRPQEKSLQLFVKNESQSFLQELQALPLIRRVEFLPQNSSYVIDWEREDLSDAIIALAAQHKVGILRIENKSENLQNLFLELTTEKVTMRNP